MTALPENRMYYRIGDVAEVVGVKPYVLRYWETEFSNVAPEKSPNGQRVYRRSEVETLLLIKHLLYTERYSIEGARKRLRELSREGQLGEAKKATVAVGKDLLARKERLQRASTLVAELEGMAQTSLSSFFRF